MQVMLDTKNNLNFTRSGSRRVFHGNPRDPKGKDMTID